MSIKFEYNLNSHLNGLEPTFDKHRLSSYDEFCAKYSTNLKRDYLLHLYNCVIKTAFQSLQSISDNVFISTQREATYVLDEEGESAIVVSLWERDGFLEANLLIYARSKK